MKRLGLLALITTASVSQAALLDDFSTGAYTSGYFSSGTVNGWTPASVPGGIRSTFIDIQSNNSGGDARLRVVTANNLFSVSNEPGVDAFARLAYGFASNTQTPSSSPMNLNLVGAPKLQLTFQNNDLPLAITAYLYTNGGTTFSFLRSAVVPGGVAPGYVQTFDFSSDAAALGDVDSILFNIDPVTNGDFSISSISTVPEPTTLVGIGLGAVALIRRRRKA